MLYMISVGQSQMASVCQSVKPKLVYSSLIFVDNKLELICL